MDCSDIIMIMASAKMDMPRWRSIEMDLRRGDTLSAVYDGMGISIGKHGNFCFDQCNVGFLCNGSRTRSLR